ncbi:MAG: hypothetical protein ACODAJ_04550, partial [Planctomycetota bacterium]
MTPKERVLASLAWQEPDRVPVQLYTTPEIQAGLQDHFGGRDVRECLGVDFRGVGPAWRGKTREPRDSIRYDIWGAGYRTVQHGSGGAYSEAVVLPLADLKTLDDVAAYPWPSPEDFASSVIPEQCERWRDYAVCLGGAGDPDIVNGVSRGRGMARVLMDIALRDEVGRVWPRVLGAIATRSAILPEPSPCRSPAES